MGRFLYVEWVPGEETYYIISPADVIKANPRTEDDHIQWLIKHNKFEVSSTVASSFRLVLIFMILNTCCEVQFKRTRTGLLQKLLSHDQITQSEL